MSPIHPSPPSRIAALDVLRGIAILGTLATNIAIFLGSSGGSGGWDRWIGTGIGLVTDGKYIGLLTIMFRIGLEIQRQSALRCGEPWLGTYPWRAAILILDGLLNYIFIFEFDVLMGYGLTGLVMCAVFATTPRFQRWALGIGVTAHVGYLAFLSRGSWRSSAGDAALAADPRTLSTAELERVAHAAGTTPSRLLQEFGRTLGDPTADPSSSGSWAGVVERVDNFWVGRAEIPIMFTMGAALFLVGAFLYRAGIFAEGGARLRRRVMLVSFGVGLPLDWVTRLWYSDVTGMFNRYLTSASVSVGILALVAHFYAGGRSPGSVGSAVRDVGRMALTCYVAQNLIASVLFLDWGLGLGRHLHMGVFNLIVAWAAISAILIALSALWLGRFDRGPLEWAWHVTYRWLVRRTTLRRSRRGNVATT